MNNVTYISGWNPKLCIQLDDYRADFNRCLFKGLPSTVALQQGGQFNEADRKQIIYQLKSQFDEKIEEGGSLASHKTIFVQTAQYLKWCDEHNTPAFTQRSLEGYMSYMDTKVMLNSCSE